MYVTLRWNTKNNVVDRKIASEDIRELLLPVSFAEEVTNATPGTVASLSLTDPTSPYRLLVVIADDTTSGFDLIAQHILIYKES